MPQSLHILSAHIIFSTKERQPWLPPTIRKRVWAYQSGILQNLECNSITIGGVADHVHVLCNLTKKLPTAKVLEILKKDSSKDVGRAPFSLAGWLRAFQCKPIAFRGGKEIHSRSRRASQKGDVPAGYLRIPKKYRAPYDERYLWD
jgi:putative transposase